MLPLSAPPPPEGYDPSVICAWPGKGGEQDHGNHTQPVKDGAHLWLRGQSTGYNDISRGSVAPSPLLLYRHTKDIDLTASSDETSWGHAFYTVNINAEKMGEKYPWMLRRRC